MSNSKMTAANWIHLQTGPGKTEGFQTPLESPPQSEYI